MEYNKAQWETISQKYDKERDELSNSALLLDDIIIDYFKNDKQQSIVLDYGAGSGTQPRQIFSFVKKVIAYEPIKEMRDMLFKHTDFTKYTNIEVIDNKSDVDKVENIDTIVCSKVLDHILDTPSALREMYGMLKSNGRLILSLAHPIKYAGAWVKDDNGAYLYYKADNYLVEGEIVRSRENVSGKQFIAEVRCQHRTISTYFNWLVEAGFEVKKMLEPKPTKESKERLPKLYEQASRIPNVLVFECYKK